jgi:hypothetical protein
MAHTAIPSSPGGETDAARGYDAVDRGSVKYSV